MTRFRGSLPDLSRSWRSDLGETAVRRFSGTPTERIRGRKLSRPKELTHVAYLLDRDYCVGFLRDGASHTERRRRAWEVVGRWRSEARSAADTAWRAQTR